MNSHKDTMDDMDPKFRSALLRALDPATGAPVAPGIEESYARLEGKMSEETIVTAPRGRRVNVTWRYLAIAAMITVVAIGIRYVPNILTTTQSTPAAQTNTYTTGPGQRLSFALSDGTRVSLAPATTLRVAGRNVELKGEAVFTVTQHTENPFTVKAGNTITKVLGTTFGVKAYDGNIRVAVQDGRVSVVGQGASLAARTQSATLNAGDVATVSRDVPTVAHNSDVASLLSWTTGTLTFDGIPLREAIPDLQRWYDVEIVVPDSVLANEPFRATFAQGSRDGLASILALTFNARAERSGRVIELTR